MAESFGNVTEQRRSGYFLLFGAVLIGVCGAVAFRYLGAPPISYLGLVVPVGILAAVGYRNVSASNDGVAVTDERRKRIVADAGHYAFWLLINVIVFDSFFRITPEEGIRITYIAVGLASLGIGYVVARYGDPLGG